MSQAFVERVDRTFRERFPTLQSPSDWPEGIPGCLWSGKIPGEHPTQDLAIHLWAEREPEYAEITVYWADSHTHQDFYDGDVESKSIEAASSLIRDILDENLAIMKSERPGHGRVDWWDSIAAIEDRIANRRPDEQLTVVSWRGTHDRVVA